MPFNEHLSLTVWHVIISLKCIFSFFLSFPSLSPLGETEKYFLNLSEASLFLSSFSSTVSTRQNNLGFDHMTTALVGCFQRLFQDCFKTARRLLEDCFRTTLRLLNQKGKDSGLRQLMTEKRETKIATSWAPGGAQKYLFRFPLTSTFIGIFYQTHSSVLCRDETVYDKQIRKLWARKCRDKAGTTSNLMSTLPPFMSTYKSLMTGIVVGLLYSPVTPSLLVKHLQNLLIVAVFVATIPFNWTG